MYAPRGTGILGGMMGIVLAVELMLFTDDGDISTALAVILLLIPVFAGIAWNRFGRRLFRRFAKGDDELAVRMADTAENIFFIAVLITLAVLYNVGLHFYW